MSNPIAIVIPPIGESIVEATVGAWLKKEGDAVRKDELLVEVESEKATFELPSPADGVLSRIIMRTGETVPVGGVVAEVTPGAAPVAVTAPSQVPAAAPAPSAPSAPPAAGPAARLMAERAGVALSQVPATGRDGRVLKEDVQRAVAASVPAPPPARVTPAPATTAPPPAQAPASSQERPERVVRMSPLRRTVAARLVQVQNEAAILTTFNEVDMSAVMTLRERYKERFLEKHGVRLGFMSFFVKAAIEALRAFPSVNAEIRGDALVFKDYFDIGVAVGSGKGLVVPVVRHADRLSFAELEKTIADFGKRAQDSKLGLEELTGGSFTISNGGVYGSMMSTPILNPPQTGILGMHAIKDRAVVENKQVVVRPMMYLALSYDHRAIDGREAVGFLVRVKECVEAPERLLFEV